MEAFFFTSLLLTLLITHSERLVFNCSTRRGQAERLVTETLVSAAPAKC